jgi:hypothetical protein
MPPILIPYSPADIELNTFGFPVGGFADGTFVMVGRNEDQATLMVGAGGDGALVQNLNRSGRFTFTLLAGSPTNRLLSAVRLTQERFRTGRGPTMMKNLVDGSRHFAAESWIVKAPEAANAKEHSPREWIIETLLLETFEGGVVL